MKKVELVAVGRILRSEGKDGTLKIKLYQKIKREPFFEKVYIGKEGEYKEYEVEGYRLVRNSPFLKLKGVVDLAGAEALRGRDILVRSEDLPPLEAGTFYDFQLLGCLVETVDGQKVGKVEELVMIRNSCLLVVKGKRGRIEIPLVEAICRVVDPEKGLIIIDPPEGLLELNEI
ncbi:MAG: ribosome maturation factor RimM [Candidatus Saccharicenans sp.]|nr:MAG: 16S rRNA processing protein RimM [Candidatus Aminicenantes bacterium]HEK86561.1 16S rRNA processing protein RimM [Candidatus Aminicenantes bacterium]